MVVHQKHMELGTLLSAASLASVVTCLHNCLMLGNIDSIGLIIPILIVLLSLWFFGLVPIFQGGLIRQ